ncbi:MAG: hypothetical protein M3377_05900, partial [Actinomycetota bacterium]|nr:hypothetical protein [Actinomycetota bacterium]
LYGLDGMAIAWVAVQAATGVWALGRVRVFCRIAGGANRVTVSPDPPLSHTGTRGVAQGHDH